MGGPSGPCQRYSLPVRQGYRGGLEPSPEGDSSEGAQSTLTEIRRYRMHRKIERNSSASIQAKRLHGTTCQACGFDFRSKYGPLGQGYIEAHHLKPMSSLAEGIPVTYDVKTDFAVLCANCHRMIHRTEEPADIVSFRAAFIQNPRGSLPYPSS